MKRVGIALAFCALLASSAVAQFGGMFPGPGTPAASGGGCSQATTFLARTSGLSGGQTTAYTNLICGLVTDGVITGTLSGAAACGAGSFDGLWVYASNTTTTANLNLCGTSLSTTVNGTCTFTANTGYTGDGTTCFLDPGFIASTNGGSMTLNSGSLGACNYVGGSGDAIGGYDGGVGILWDVGGAPVVELNGSTFPSVAITTGALYITRTASTGLTVYSNGASSTTPADTSGHLLTVKTYFIADNNNGTATNFSAAKLSYAFVGGGFTGTQVTNMYNRFHTFLTAVGAPAGC